MIFKVSSNPNYSVTLGSLRGEFKVNIKDDEG